ncbi:3,4-dihydroxy 2-butanone 4-phosphate synthase/GTP cyclohydrolase II [Branchiibius hedensis]|uniref:Riboflavin biosynthesis protein RibBA n=1 Tax=Branchiibius hedensis TaxID=672460 RepID=A0A2Y8ZP78_9MICO|nr:bifunctional 3,4-dihydroxy-2-butanone-4-phosphate synthase/GTP cyclohydrolase II [Branchiibius hedensis]PWJ25326.1 3,4-dihydroxy 2-butanone 4-phosphate synthase/GTP cyclohydrolase II [Branchiibius hedensis]SSA34140.1 3,4-dihydroxy 2-butanone 4-phosphate synthase / GTP cyclohydrolase II [Branchiibius hedensis]
MTTRELASVEDALREIAAGRPVFVVDDEDRENEADLVMAACAADERWIGFAVRYGSGVLCAPVTGEIADRLALPPMVSDNQDPKGTAYTVSVDARKGVSTGISAADRARTLRLLADPATSAEDLTRPGHVFPLRARDGGVLERPGHTEAAVDLARLAGLEPVGAIVELVHDDGSMMRLGAAQDLAEREGLLVISIADLIAWRQRHDRVRRVASTRLPTAYGEFTAHGYLDLVTGAEHVALVMAGGDTVRVHSECLTGDVFGSQRCDCGPQLEASLTAVARDGGAVVYLGGHEGRGVGLLNKLRAYSLQDTGLDTVDAQTALGLPVDAREFSAAAAILRDRGLTSVQLLTNNPAKEQALRGAGIEVTARLPLHVGASVHNLDYLATKLERMGHLAPEPTILKGAS